ncbi:MAG: hypothetical protein H5T63_05695 [Chloroflexi bacterium]|nr:hypothetical protein [Chloroflexota bacterium]
MRNPVAWWAISAALVLLPVVWIGIKKKDPFIILVDDRNRYSLSQLQITLWTILVLSLLLGVFLARKFAPNAVTNPLAIEIPDELLIVMGISVGSTTVASAIKANKDATRAAKIRSREVRPYETSIRAATTKRTRSFWDLILTEEGDPNVAERIDPTKFQNLWLTLIVVAAYAGTAVAVFAPSEVYAAACKLPGFSSNLTTLLGISHAGYLAGKLPNRD